MVKKRSPQFHIAPLQRVVAETVTDPAELAAMDEWRLRQREATSAVRLRENGRITLMWCAFTGPPKVLRVHGRGEPVFRDDPRWPALIGHFADGPGARAIILVHATKVSDSCGFAVPFMDYREERTQHAQHFGRKSEDEFAAYCANKEFNGHSIDGLPALPLPLPPRSA